MDHDQLYESGDSRYDQYFENVHREQGKTTDWDGERSAGRKPVIAVLALPPNASDTTILIATREHRTEPDLPRAVEETAHAERERAAKLNHAAAPMEDLARQGDSLEPLVRQVFQAQGETKIREVRAEVNAAVSSMRSLSSRARGEATDAEGFVDDLRGALAGQRATHDHHGSIDTSSPKPAPTTPPASTTPAPPLSSSTAAPAASNSGAGTVAIPPPKPPKPAKPDDAAKPAKPDDAKPKPDDTPKPDKSKPSDEVFNP